MFIVGAAGFAALFLWGLGGLPGFGHYRGIYGLKLARVGVAQRRATDIVSSVTFDYRGFDTMGEEFILLASVVGLAVLLRSQRDELGIQDAGPRVGRETSDLARLVGLGLVGPMVVLGVYIVVHGQLTPGGGFQGGIIFATALILIYLVGRYPAMRAVSPRSLVEVAEGGGAAGLVLIGFGGLVFTGTFFYNFLCLGHVHSLLSGGMIPLANVAVGIEVAGGLVLLWSEFLDQELLQRRGRRVRADGSADPSRRGRGSADPSGGGAG